MGPAPAGSPQHTRKAADLNGDTPRLIDLSKATPAAVRAAERALSELAEGKPLPDGYAARTAAAILGDADHQVIRPAAYITTSINAHPDRYWPPRMTV